MPLLPLWLARDSGKTAGLVASSWQVPSRCQTVSVIVETKVGGSKDTELLHLPVPVDIGSLRDLLVLLVSH